MLSAIIILFNLGGRACAIKLSLSNTSSFFFTFLLLSASIEYILCRHSKLLEGKTRNRREVQPRIRANENGEIKFNKISSANEEAMFAGMNQLGMRSMVDTRSKWMTICQFECYLKNGNNEFLCQSRFSYKTNSLELLCKDRLKLYQEDGEEHKQLHSESADNEICSKIFSMFKGPVIYQTLELETRNFGEDRTKDPYSLPKVIKIREIENSLAGTAPNIVFVRYKLHGATPDSSTATIYQLAGTLEKYYELIILENIRIVSNQFSDALHRAKHFEYRMDSRLNTADICTHDLCLFKILGIGTSRIRNLSLISQNLTIKSGHITVSLNEENSNRFAISLSSISSDKWADAHIEKNSIAISLRGKSMGPEDGFRIYIRNMYLSAETKLSEIVGYLQVKELEMKGSSEKNNSEKESKVAELVKDKAEALNISFWFDLDDYARTNVKDMEKMGEKGFKMINYPTPPNYNGTHFNCRAHWICNAIKKFPQIRSNILSQCEFCLQKNNGNNNNKTACHLYSIASMEPNELLKNLSCEFNPHVYIIVIVALIVFVGLVVIVVFTGYLNWKRFLGIGPPKVPSANEQASQIAGSSGGKSGKGKLIIGTGKKLEPIRPAPAPPTGADNSKLASGTGKQLSGVSSQEPGPSSEANGQDDATTSNLSPPTGRLKGALIQLGIMSKPRPIREKSVNVFANLE